MRAWKAKEFNRWARKEGLSDDDLFAAATEIVSGRFEGDLGGSVVKKRIAREHEGKRGGYRTIVAFRAGSGARVFFLHGYPKNEKANISTKEKAALKLTTKSLLGLTSTQIQQLETDGALIRITKSTTVVRIT